MANGVYKTALGKTINMDNLRLQHEREKAVGNMNANARGDTIAPDGTVIQNRNARVNTKYVHKPPVNPNQIKKR